MHRIHVRTSPERAYDAIATAQGVRNWWTTDVEIDERVGGRARFRFYDGSQHWGVRIDEMIPNTRIVWDVEDSSIPGLPGTLVRFDIKTIDGDVVIDLTQSGLPKADEVLAIFTSGWYLYLSSLRQYLETGMGHPHPYLDFAHPNLWFTRSEERNYLDTAASSRNASATAAVS